MNIDLTLHRETDAKATAGPWTVAGQFENQILGPDGHIAVVTCNDAAAITLMRNDHMPMVERLEFLEDRFKQYVLIAQEDAAEIERLRAENADLMGFAHPATPVHVKLTRAENA